MVGGFVWAFAMAMYASISTITNGPQHPHHLLHYDSSAVHHCLIHNTQTRNTVVNTVRFSHQSKGPSPFFTRDRSPTPAAWTVVLLGTSEQNVNHICARKRYQSVPFQADAPPLQTPLTETALSR